MVRRKIISMRAHTMKMIPTFASASLLALALSVAACGGTTAADQGPQTAQSALTTAPIGVATHGPVKMVADALGDVPLRADQRTELEKLATEAEARHQATASAHKDLMEAVAVQIEAGSIDRAALQPKIDAAANAWKSVQDADRASLERVHAILDASQREKFVDALQARMKAARSEHEGKAKGHEGGIHAWAADLKLTDAQREQLKQAFRDNMKAHGAAAGLREGWKEHHARAGKVMDAFKTDHFVLDEVAPKQDPQAIADKMSGRILHMAEVALPILTPEQRSIAAAESPIKPDGP
jgi:Spy/CpxP family protein refolding chaperone